MYGNHYPNYGEGASLGPRLSVDDEMLAGVKSAKKKSIFLDTKPSLDKRPSYGFSAQNKVGNTDLNVTGSKLAFIEETISDDIIYKCSVPIYRVLRAMGVFPYTRNFPGQAEMKIASPAMGYSVFIFIVMLVS